MPATQISFLDFASSLRISTQTNPSGGSSKSPAVGVAQCGLLSSSCLSAQSIKAACIAPPMASTISPISSDIGTYMGSDATATVCPPSVQQAALAVVAHPLAVDGGECIPFVGVFTPSRSISHSDYRPDFTLEHESMFGCGLDAPEFLPGGSHASWSPIPTYVKADGYGAFMRGL